MDLKKVSLRSVSFIGSILFSTLFILTYVQPQAVENTAKYFIESELTDKVNLKIESLSVSDNYNFKNIITKRSNFFKEEADKKISKLKAQLKNKVPEIIEQELILLRNINCVCRINLKKTMHDFKVEKLLSLELAKEKIKDFTQVKYMEIVEKITLDIRIFTGSNTILFFIILLLSFIKTKEINHLILPSTLMMLSMVICSYFYLFEQNWFYTIIYDSYTGFAFLSYLFIVFLILSDIAINQARITIELINAFVSAITMISFCG